MYALLSLFLNIHKDASRLIRERIEFTAEETFENSRRKSFAESSIELGESISNMSDSEREELRVQCLRDLDEQRFDIYYLWETIIRRAASFQIVFEITTWIIFLITAISVFVKSPTFIVVFGIASIIFLLISKTPTLFRWTMYVSTGLNRVTMKLLDAYYRYGRLEAAITFADWRDISHVSKTQQKWIFTTSHKDPPQG